MNNKRQFWEAGNVFWLLQSTTDLPLSEQQLAHHTLLSHQERIIFAALKSDKRRRDWLLGRWTAKQLVQQVAEEKLGLAVPLTKFSILARPDGSPQVIWEQTQPATGFYCSISISHSAGVAFCALVEGADWPLGADIEFIQPRIIGFAGDYFSTVEQALVERCVEAWRPMLVTAIWSGKEAALKALRTGLREDTRSVSCLIEPVASSPGEWTPFVIQWEAHSLERPLPRLTGWWQVQDSFVLTLAVRDSILSFSF
jgi:4'-phosphopantetheinyl transferase